MQLSFELVVDLLRTLLASYSLLLMVAMLFVEACRGILSIRSVCSYAFWKLSDYVSFRGTVLPALS